MIYSSTLHSFVTEYVVKSHWWLVANTEPMSIHLATGSEVVSDSLCTVPIVFYNMSGHAIT